MNPLLPGLSELPFLPRHRVASVGQLGVDLLMSWQAPFQFYRRHLLISLNPTQ